MAGCQFCETPPSGLDHGTKVYSQCDLLEGGPCHSCREYIDIENRIQVAKNALQDLVAQRRAIRTRINQTHDPITRRFPTEIISLIFQHVLPDEWSSFDQLCRETVNRAPISGPLFLGSVCGAWRRIAWSTPSLWTIIRLVIKKDGDNLNRTNVAKEWLTRAGQLPLSIRITFWSGYDERYDWNAIQDLIDAINGHSSRWGKLEVQGPVRLLSGLSEGIQNAPNLHTFRAAATNDGGGKLVLDSPHFRPKHVALSYFFLESLNFDWSHVTRLTLVQYTPGECLEILRRSSRLLHCDLHKVYSGDNLNFPLPDQHLTHTSLQTLCVHPNRTGEPPRTDGSDVLDKLILPSLRNVEIPGFDSASLLELITRSSCSITSLTIWIGAEEYTNEYDDDDEDDENLSLDPFLLKAPLLQHLSLKSNDYIHTTDDIFQFLAQLATIPQSVSDSNNGQIMLPNLQSLDIIGFTLSNWSLGRFLRLLGPIADLRHPRKRQLNKIRVQWNDQWDDPWYRGSVYIDRDVALKLKELRDGGISLDLIHREGDLLDLALAHYASQDAGSVRSRVAS